MISSQPFWTVVWVSAIGLYNLYLYAEQDKLNEVTEFIYENPDKFTKSIVSSTYFRSNFLKFLGEYLKQSNKRKREALKKILLQSLSKEEDEKFEIDRLNNVLSQISLGAIRNLLFIKSHFIPQIEKEIEYEVQSYDHKNNPKEITRLKDITKARKNISDYIQRWIHDNFDPDSHIVKQKYHYDDSWDQAQKMKFNTDHSIKKHTIEKEIHSYWPEYVSLGIMSSVTDGVGQMGGAGGTVYKLTQFGESFIEFIEP